MKHSLQANAKSHCIFVNGKIRCAGNESRLINCPRLIFKLKFACLPEKLMSQQKITPKSTV